MRVLALEPYYGGSHRAFLDGWRGRSRHRWDVLTLPAHKWKWRMRHAAITFAEQLARHHPSPDSVGRPWDVVFCSDMLNLAEFRGLAPLHVAALPAVVYFHENQLTYPVRVESERDYQYVLTNFTTALAAQAVWFNSAYHRDTFLDALGPFFRRMPDNAPLSGIQAIRKKSAVHPPGIEAFEPCGVRRPGPARILWAARWEHDKNPEDFFAAVETLHQGGLGFRLGVIGQQFREVPAVFEHARDRFADRIDHWGFQADRQAYRQVLQWADIVVSTARHEFFGIGLIEAVAAGARPLAPDRLAYPEVLGRLTAPEPPTDSLYDGSVDDLARKLAGCIAAITDGPAEARTDRLAARAQTVYGWDRIAPVLDGVLEAVVKTTPAAGPNE